MTEILLAVIKSTAVNITKLVNYNIEKSEPINEILLGLNLLNHSILPLNKCKIQIQNLVNLDLQLIETLYNEQIKHFGTIDSTEVSFSTRKGKAILVSGENLLDLEHILRATEDKNIDVYTHDELLVAHIFEKFRNYKNLKGHYGTCSENCVLDFATFPGAILLTKNSSVNIEYLYRGRIFTTSKMLPQGVISVKDSDFTELIKSANNAKGFAKGQTRKTEEIGYNPKKLKEDFKNLSKRLNSGEINHIIVLGHGAASQEQQLYFNKLISLLPPEVFVLSFSINIKHPNFIHINISNSRIFVYKILKELFEITQIDFNKITFFITKCDINSISNIISLTTQGLKNVYLTQCSPNIINPAILATIKSVYNIKSVQEPELDLKTIL